MPSRRHALALLAAALSPLPAPLPAARAEDPPLDPALEADGWRMLTKGGVPPTRFARDPDGAIAIRTAGSNALIYRAVPPEQAHATRFAWRWRVEAAMPAADLAVKGGDDRPVSVYLAFAPDPERTGFFRRLRNGIARNILGIPLTGYVLTYSWGGTNPEGSLFENPHLPGDGAVFIRRNAAAPLGTWMAETVDVAGDFRRAFGFAPTAAKFIALAADGEDTGVPSLARVADLTLS